MRVASLEEKLGLHGSPTALVHLEGAEGFLVGERRRGLVTYVMALIHGARLEVAAQAVGIGQAAFAAAVRYVHERRQFDRAIEEFAPVRQQILEMEVLLQASRNLVYRTAEVVDRMRGLSRMVARHPDDPRVPTWRDESKRLARVEDVLTPLTKYWAAEAGNAVCYRALQMHGGYGYCREYQVERHVRDVRVTNLYEGTSEIQVGGIVGLLASGEFEVVLAEVASDLPDDPADAEARARFEVGVRLTREACAFLASPSLDKNLLQLRARPLADMVADVGRRRAVPPPRAPRPAQAPPRRRVPPRRRLALGRAPGGRHGRGSHGARRLRRPRRALPLLSARRFGSRDRRGGSREIGR